MMVDGDLFLCINILYYIHIYIRTHWPLPLSNYLYYFDQSLLIINIIIVSIVIKKIIWHLFVLKKKTIGFFDHAVLIDKLKHDDCRGKLKIKKKKIIM